MIRALVFCAGIAGRTSLTAGQVTPSPCKVAPIWEATAIVSTTKIGEVDNGEQGLEVGTTKQMVSYDTTSQRTSMEEVFIIRKNENVSKSYVHVIDDYSRHEGFKIVKSETGLICYRFRFRGQFPTMSPPEGAKFVGSHEIGTAGLPDEGVLTDAWATDLNETAVGKFSGHAVWTYTHAYNQNPCVPISFDIQNETYVHSAKYYDVTLGLRNPDVFTPPAACQDAKWV
jgi:hypothetical protein